MRNLIIVALFAGGCTGSDDEVVETTETTEAPDTTPLIGSVSATCLDDRWTVSVSNTFAAATVSSYILDTVAPNPDNWDETHSLALSAEVPEAPLAQTWSVTTFYTNAFGSVKDGTSVFRCDQEANLTFGIKLFDDAFTVTDCAVFGARPEDLVNGDYTSNSLSPTKVGTGQFGDCDVFAE